MLHPHHSSGAGNNSNSNNDNNGHIGPPGPSGAPGAPARPAPSAASGDDILREMLSTSLGPLSRLSDTLNLTLDEVSEWIAKPESRRQIFNLLGLLNAQTELLLAQQRVMAAVQLSRLAREEHTPPETLRRACKDLLNIRVIERFPKHLGGAAAAAGHGDSAIDDLAPVPLPRKPLFSEEELQKLIGKR